MQHLSVKERACDWLERRLEAGPVDSTVIRTEGAELGFSRTTLYRAARTLAIVAVSEPETPVIYQKSRTRASFWYRADDPALGDVR